MYQGLLHLHNVGRWIVLILLLVAIINSMTGIASGRTFSKKDKTIGLLLMTFAHIMLLVGLYQWIAGPWGLKNIQNMGMAAVMKDKVARFWAVEHLGGMLLGIILITLGKGVAKKPIRDRAKFRRSFWLFLIALILIFMSVPWPFRDVARPLFPGVSL